ncbi:MAG: hypothetical protein HFH39_06420 [Lachnospiraceae bacterium]|nr:hypothetical protein [Lachnospiraceae bacterium]
MWESGCDRLDAYEMKNVDVRTVDRNQLVDITKISVNNGDDTEKRRQEFIEKVKNPYCFLVGGVVVKVAFTEDGSSFEKQFEDMLLKLG